MTGLGLGLSSIQCFKVPQISKEQQGGRFNVAGLGQGQLWESRRILQLHSRGALSFSSVLRGGSTQVALSMMTRYDSTEC